MKNEACSSHLHDQRIFIWQDNLLDRCAALPIEVTPVSGYHMPISPIEVTQVSGYHMSISPIVQALRAADEALAAECPYDQLPMEPETGIGENEVNTTCTTRSLFTREGDDEAQVDADPDDMAAAFFDAQAKKQEAESRLPTKEWVQLLPGVRLQTEKMPDSKGATTNAKEPEMRSLIKDQEPEMRSLIKEQLVAKLHQEYEKALTTSNCSGVEKN